MFLVLDKNKYSRYISCVTFFLVCHFRLFVIRQFCDFDQLKSKNNETYEMTTTLIDCSFNFTLCVLYICTVIYKIRCEEMILVTRKFGYSQYFQMRTPVLYLKFDCF